MKNHCITMLLTLLLFGCGKEEDAQSPIIGTWQVVSYETRTGGGSWSPSPETCRLDDTEEYAASGRWTRYDGTDQCSAGTGILSGTWKLRASDTKIVYTYDGFGDEYESTVEELSATRLIISWSAGDVKNTQYRTTLIKK